jgi:hypothetical protein
MGKERPGQTRPTPHDVERSRQSAAPQRERDDQGREGDQDRGAQHQQVLAAAGSPVAAVIRPA